LSAYSCPPASPRGSPTRTDRSRRPAIPPEKRDLRDSPRKHCRDWRQRPGWCPSGRERR
jgi:hypothetical protein